jgi:hypothetical protein
MTEVTANLWDYNHPRKADALVITTNGSIRQDGLAVMGRGVANQAIGVVPGIQKALGGFLRKYGNRVGVIAGFPPQPYIVCLPVKPTWDVRADLDLIRLGLRELDALATASHWTQVVLPRPGCGNGQLQWEAVKPLLATLDHRFLVVFREGF